MSYLKASTPNAESPSMIFQLPTESRARHQVSQPYAFAPSPFPTRPGSPSLISSRLEGLLIEEDHALLRTGKKLAKQRQVISIDTLPDDALLEIFRHFIDDFRDKEEAQAAWQLLVHVCRRWRHIVFESPRRLDLRLLCTEGTPARDTLDVWPGLPLVLSNNYPIRNMDNIMAVLERSDRVGQISLKVHPNLDVETILAALQRPFPELTHLRILLDDPVPVVPDSFLGGSAPQLQSLSLSCIPLPGLPKLLLSATHLVDLYLWSVPHSGYFSPNVMATAFSTLTSLSCLHLGFESPESRPDWASRRPPPKTRSVLPVFADFVFKGANEYLEDLVACIDSPRLDKFDITFFNDITFDTPQLVEFITRTPKSKAFEKARITLSGEAARVEFSSQTSRDGNFRVEILCKGLDWQVSSLEQVCTSCFPPLSMLEDLYFREQQIFQPVWRGSIDNGLWLELLQPFTAVKNLYLTDEFASRIVPALQELVEGRITEVLPTLQNIFLEGLWSSRPVQEVVEQFVAARQVAGHPITLSRWTTY